MFRSPLRSFWAFISSFLPPHLAVMGWDDALIYAIIASMTAAAGTAASNKANNRQIEAQDAARRADQFRQAELQRQSDEETRRQLVNLSPEKTNADVEQAVAARTAATVSPDATPPTQYQTANVAAPVEVNADLTRRMTGEQGAARAEAEARARLAAFGDASMGQDNEIARIGERLRRFQRESRGQSGLLPWQLNAARDKGGNWQTAANIANVVSDIGTRYAMNYRPQPGIGYGAASNPAALGATQGPF